MAAVAAPAQAREDRQLWTSVAASVKLGGDWRLSQDIVARFSDNRNGHYEIESSTLLGYKLTPDVTIAAGYVHNPQYADGDLSAKERRAREQVSVDNFAKVGPGKLSARLRLEQRWRDGVDGTGWRARPFLRWSMPLAGKTRLLLSNETFLNLNTTSFQRQEGFDRMRNQAAISVPLSKEISAEAGYLNQHFFVRGGPDNIDHVASLSLSFSL
jgi:hypothetical protein